MLGALDRWTAMDNLCTLVEYKKELEPLMPDNHKAMLPCPSEGGARMTDPKLVHLMQEQENIHVFSWCSKSLLDAV